MQREYMNHVELKGNLTRDVELRTLPKGGVVCDFGVAINHREPVPGEPGVVRESVEFIDCTAWEDQAKGVASGRKGNPVHVVGRLVTESWTDKKTGLKRYKTKVLVATVQVGAAA